MGRGAVIESGRVLHYGDPRGEIVAAQTGGVVCDLSHLGLIRVAGEDAGGFLQSQFCNDVSRLEGSSCQWNGYCSPKGRLLASFLLWRDEAGYLMQLPASLREAIQKRLSMFVLRSKVRLTDASDEFVRVGFAGPGAAAVLAHNLGTVPHVEMATLQTEFGTLLSLGGNRFELLATPQTPSAVWGQLFASSMKVGTEVWQWLEIRAGIPSITPATQEQFVPQMVNFDLIGGVSFQKGCYPGQEIVARTRYLGRLKRRMYLAHLDTDAAPQPGDDLYSADLGGQASGTLVNTAAAPEGGYDVLAVIQIDSAASQAIHWKRADGPALELRRLPYPVP